MSSKEELYLTTNYGKYIKQQQNIHTFQEKNEKFSMINYVQGHNIEINTLKRMK